VDAIRIAQEIRAKKKWGVGGGGGESGKKKLQEVQRGSEDVNIWKEGYLRKGWEQARRIQPSTQRSVAAISSQQLSRKLLNARSRGWETKETKDENQGVGRGWEIRDCE
jgi:hypothetical protein